MNTFAPRLLLGFALAGLVALTIAATGAAAPARATAGTLHFCTDATYPPEEFFQGTKMVGLRHRHRDRGREAPRTDGEVPEHGLRRHHRGAAREEVRRDHQRHERHGRAAQAGRVRRLHLGRPVADGEEGQPEGHQDARRPVGQVRVGRGRARRTRRSSTSREHALKKKGKPAIKIVTFPKDTDAANALKTGRVDAYFGDSPVVAYYIAARLVVRVRRARR